MSPWNAWSFSTSKTSTGVEITMHVFTLSCSSQFKAAFSKLALSSLTLLCVIITKPAYAGPLFVDPLYGVSTTSNVQYGANVNGFGSNVSLTLDIYRPTEQVAGSPLPAELPAIALMHGGYFAFGDSKTSNMVNLATQFAKRGYVAVSINYRKVGDLPPPPGDSPVPIASRIPNWLSAELVSYGVTLQQYVDTIAAATEDQAAAVNWLVDNAATYDINPDWIAAGGYSAGAVSSLLLGAGAIDGVSADIGAVFSMAGGMFGYESYFDSNEPGVFMLHGTSDTTVPYSEVPFLQSALSAAGVPYESLILSGAGHSSSTLRNALLANPDPFFEFMSTQLVPEPSTWMLAATGLLGLVPLTRRARRKI